MNHYIDAQCRNMIAMVATFEKACEMAAREDDGKTSKEEEKKLKLVRTAADRFKMELNKIAAK